MAANNVTTNGGLVRATNRKDLFGVWQQASRISVTGLLWKSIVDSRAFTSHPANEHRIELKRHFGAGEEAVKSKDISIVEM